MIDSGMEHEGELNTTRTHPQSSPIKLWNKALRTQSQAVNAY